MLAATPFILLALIASEEAIIFASLLIGLILAFMNVGPSNAIIVNVTDPKIRAAAFAVNIFLIHILGDIPSPTLMGAVSDLFGGKLFWGIALTLPAMAASGVFFCLGSPHLAADEEAVLRGLRSPAPAEATPPASLE
jgi:MFS family permease